MKNNVEKQIFKKGSTTYFWSSLFFPKKVRQDVFRLYSFVRVVDDYVDKKFPDTKNFEQVVALYEGKKPAKASQKNRRVASNMHLVEKKYELDKSWGVAFIKSMRMDIKQKRYKNIDDSLDYVYGSAEVIGLMMSKILGIDISSAITKKSATMQGRAMQWINFIRDIDEDNLLGRQYFPLDTLAKFDLKILVKKNAKTSRTILQILFVQKSSVTKIGKSKPTNLTGKFLDVFGFLLKPHLICTTGRRSKSIKTRKLFLNAKLNQANGEL